MMMKMMKKMKTFCQTAKFSYDKMISQEQNYPAIKGFPVLVEKGACQKSPGQWNEDLED